MPLSEDEQRILQEIEAQFYANDPQLAQQVSETTLYRHASRNIKWAALGFVVPNMFGLIPIGGNDIWLHCFLGVVLVAFGFMAKDEAAAAAAMA